ncbi:hypothetical protein BP5796_11793 [Coleophoma crateriformis]|uniref:SPT2 chromatin protein n=1 Tax=Coleophoma crateriformis TaxID=565419 RepID=A0A3D8QEM1_9HELO|nr:hypothetical protein BP5796_11793 [Coleophoma crateriformis]
MPIGDLLAQISGEPSPTLAPSTLPPKRKADNDLRQPVDKVQKMPTPAANSSRPMSQPRPPTLNTSMDRMKIGMNGRNSGSAQAAAPKSATPPVSATAPKAPPKKGSFAEILARGKAAQATLGPVGKIQHKKIEKRPTKKEMEDAKAQQAKNVRRGVERNGVNGKSSKPGQGPSRDPREGTKKVDPEPEKKVKKAATATTGYAGTARPKPGSSQSRPSPRYGREEPRRNGSGSGYGGTSKRYTYVSDDEDDEDMEEEEDYASDVSSDMEAAAFEVDEEEELAARIARKEDAEALAEENRLKREKAERKRRLEAMARKSRN